MRQPVAGTSGAGRGTVRRRERLQPARGYVMRIKLSVEERDQIRAAAAQAGMAPAGFTARAALDAAVTGVVPVGARSALERMVGFQVELVAVRRSLDLLRAEMSSGAGDPAAGAVAEMLRRCGEAAEQLTHLSGMVHRRLGGR
jgi:hypothetical protein